ncbi:hypothetical protein EJ02DRAFT_227852 [Clathrospora elynae]|uniref:Uncharacterized protein n=1 Tax=Clathrospora elynae TaxID=706981 RepID=A0A6A5SL41_9PLEO|nr:hypothetical protein EJ02DRAFT_227852 [Clathrospora elynae]
MLLRRLFTIPTCFRHFFAIALHVFIGIPAHKLRRLVSCTFSPQRACCKPILFHIEEKSVRWPGCFNTLHRFVCVTFLVDRGGTSPPPLLQRGGIVVVYRVVPSLSVLWHHNILYVLQVNAAVVTMHMKINYYTLKVFVPFATSLYSRC